MKAVAWRYIGSRSISTLLIYKYDSELSIKVYAELKDAIRKGVYYYLLWNANDITVDY